MSVFVDSSALYALIDHRDQMHSVAQRIWAGLLPQRQLFITTSYVQLETVTLIQRRLGLSVAREFHAAFSPVLRTVWIDEQLHNSGMAYLLTSGRRFLSLVDCTSFLVCRQPEVEAVFAFDRHFTEQGFRTLA